MGKNVIKRGSKGDEVSLWQSILNEDIAPTTWCNAAGTTRTWTGWAWPLTVDGDFGAKTQAATEAWQAARGLEPDGVVGANTWSAALEGRAKDVEDDDVVSTARTEQAFVGSRLVDSYPYSLGGTAEQAKRLAATGVDGLFGYLGVINRARVDQLLAAGVAFNPVTLANRFDGAKALAQLRALGVPTGTSVALDLEGQRILNGQKWFPMPHAEREKHVKEIIAACASWRDKVGGAGYRPMLYIGSPQPLTTEELTNLKFQGYWNAGSREQDRFGLLAEPKRGYQVWQMSPQHFWKDTGVFVDVDFTGQDFYESRLHWMRGSFPR